MKYLSEFQNVIWRVQFIYKRVFSFRLQSSYIRECSELGCNILNEVLTFISKRHANSSIGNPTQKLDLTVLVHEVQLNESQNKINARLLIS